MPHNADEYADGFMFICPTCYREIEEPEYIYGFLRPFSGGFGRRGPYPVCPCGRNLTSAVVGDFSEQSLAAASLCGLGLSLIGLVLAGIADARMRQQGKQIMILPIAIGLFALLGMIALWMGYLWSSQRGPMTKLAPRAYGAAFGYFIPSGALAAFLLGGLRDLSFIERALERIFS